LKKLLNFLQKYSKKGREEEGEAAAMLHPGALEKNWTLNKCKKV
jgi:hypothetical protein